VSNSGVLLPGPGVLVGFAGPIHGDSLRVAASWEVTAGTGGRRGAHRPRAVMREPRRLRAARHRGSPLAHGVDDELKKANRLGSIQHRAETWTFCGEHVARWLLNCGNRWWP
jgi:hypothetical protein